jgi:hypothetical protein
VTFPSFPSAVELLGVWLRLLIYPGSTNRLGPHVPQYVKAPETEKQALTRNVRTLCAWAAGLHVGSIPASTLAVLVVDENIAAILSAVDEPEIFAWHDRVIGASRGQQSTLFRARAPRARSLHRRRSSTCLTEPAFSRAASRA